MSETLWTDGVHKCVVERTVDHHVELRLIVEGRVLRRETYKDEDTARIVSREWFMALIAPAI
jgi:hypothetical protein